MYSDKRILIIDDEPDFIEVIAMRLEANGYEVLRAYNGEEGLRTAVDEKPNLILLDVMMPGMDGFQTLREIRKTVGVRTTPVIMLTAKGESKSIRRGQELGATDYLIKPFDAEDLLELLARHA